MQPPAPTAATVAAAAASRPLGGTLRATDLIVIHCSATPSGRRLSFSESPAAVIDRWHAQRGFKRQEAARQAFNPLLLACGYHFVIDVDGRLYTGRALNEPGAHAVNFNARSIGVCLIGGAERDGQYTPEAWNRLEELVLLLCHERRIPLRLATQHQPLAGVCGHRDLSPDANGDGQVTARDWLKTCPGFDVGAWIAAGCKPAERHLWRGVAQ